MLVRPFCIGGIFVGGWGSGGRNKTHGTIERYWRIDSFELLRCIDAEDEPHDLIDPVFYGNHRLRLHWVDGVDGTPSRLYFGCPQCRRRVRYLYACGDGYVCRNCLNANYESQQLRPGTVSHVRMQMRKLVEDQLGYTWWKHDNPGRQIEELDIIPKPRYMRWAKYSALMMKYQELQDEYWRAFIRQYPLAIPPEMMAALSKYL